jgi:putative glycosyltransferase (TIGR04348 family)
VILLVSPAPDGLHGNGVTARRWAAILRELGRLVHLTRDYPGAGDHSAIIALHAGKSADAVRRFHADHPDAPVVVALTGTDLYPDLTTTGVDPEILRIATRLVVLQPRGLDQLDPATRAKAVVIIQSVPPIPPQPPRTDCFEVAFLAHVRPVKDPLRLAAAVRLLPPASRVRVSHAGEARDDALAAEATAEATDNPRYDWLGPLPREQALALLRRSRLLALTSLHEGGANVISEALAGGVPVIASKIPGSIGLLGPDYPGYFPPGDSAALAAALDAAEHDRDGYYTALREHCAPLRRLVAPAREKRAWADLLAELPLPTPHH